MEIAANWCAVASVTTMTQMKIKTFRKLLVYLEAVNTRYLLTFNQDQYAGLRQFRDVVTQGDLDTFFKHFN